MPVNQHPQLVDGRFGLVHLLTETLEGLGGPVAEEVDQNVVLVLEIQVDRTVRDPGLAGNLGNGGFVETLLGEDLDGGFQNALVLVVGFGFSGDDEPLSDRD
jgi:hypothetical protein